MRAILAAILIIASSYAVTAGADDCARTYNDLGKSERLKSLRAYFPPGESGYVNESKGSYFVMSHQGGELMLTFYTSGLFNLFPIKRSGPVVFCDDGKGLRVSGLGIDERVYLENGKLLLGRGGPKRVFEPGHMPELLVKLHEPPTRGIASTPQK